MFGFDIAALMSLFGLTSAFGVIGLALAGWMAWRIVEKAGFRGWAGLVAVLLVWTGVLTIVPLVLLWVFAFMRWPRDNPASPAYLAAAPTGAPSAPGAPGAGGRPSPALPPPMRGALTDQRRGWQLVGTIATGGVTLAFDATASSWLLTGAAAAKANELSLPDPSVGQPHARLLVAGTRLGLEDLGSPGGTYIDGARLLPEHGPRDITGSRTIRLGKVDLALSRV
jgi:hypothetical protein